MAIRLILTIIALVLVLPHLSQAAEPTEDFLKSLKTPPSQQLDERDKNAPHMKIEGETKPSEPAGDIRLTFTTFVLVGDTLLTKAEIDPIISPFIGENLTVAQLQRLADLITKLYAQKGYSTSFCYIPQQNIENGKVTFQCVEPTIGKLIIQNAEDYNEKLFVQFIRPLRNRPLNVNELNERLKTLSLTPTFIADVEIKRTNNPKEVDVYIDLKAKPINTAEISADNNGSRFAGRERVSAVYNLANPTGYGDLLSLQAMSTVDISLSHMFSATYKRLMNSHGGLLTLSGIISDYKVDQSIFPRTYSKGQDGNPVLDAKPEVKGTNDGFTVNYRHPLIVDNRAIVTGYVQYEYKDVTSKTYVHNWRDIQSDLADKTHVITVGTDIEMVDRLGGWEVLGLSVSQGLNGFFGGMSDSDAVQEPTSAGVIRGAIRRNVKPGFTLISGNLYRRQTFTVGALRPENTFTAYGQYTRARVPSAYTFADGDYGGHLSTDFRLPIIGNALKASVGASVERYYNTKASTDLALPNHASIAYVSYGVLGTTPWLNIDYNLTYNQAVKGNQAGWQELRNLNMLTFSASMHF